MIIIESVHSRSQEIGRLVPDLETHSVDPDNCLSLGPAALLDFSGGIIFLSSAGPGASRTPASLLFFGWTRCVRRGTAMRRALFVD